MTTRNTKRKRMIVQNLAETGTLKSSASGAIRPEAAINLETERQC
jgi:hypothetical protein